LLKPLETRVKPQEVFHARRCVTSWRLYEALIEYETLRPKLMLEYSHGIVLSIAVSEVQKRAAEATRF
jgi:hypothetical protein